MTVNELYLYLNRRIPSELSLDWDNDGLSVCVDGQKTVRRVLVTLDVNLDVIKYAADHEFDVIISHHPLLFNGLKAVNSDSVSGRRVCTLVKAGIACMSFHTRLDALDGGVNDVLVHALGLQDVRKFGQEQIGRIGDLEKAMELEDFAEAVRTVLGAEAVACAGNVPVRRVAVIGGSGDYSDADAAAEAGADTFLSGELKYHLMADAVDEGRNFIMAGHFHTEHLVCGMLADMVKNAFPDVYVEIKKINNIKIIK